MKRKAFKSSAATVAAAIMVAGATSATAGNLDEPIAEVTPVAPVVVPVVQTNDWTGGYVGGSLGYADVSEDADAFDDDGVTYGVHGGYDYDFGSFVLGGELEVSGFDVADAGIDVDSVTRAKIRAGYDAGQFLPYVTAGIAQLNTGAGFDGDDTGAVYGVGLDYAYTDNIRVGGEILQHEFDDFDGAGLDLDATTASVRVAYEF